MDQTPVIQTLATPNSRSDCFIRIVELGSIYYQWFTNLNKFTKSFENRAVWISEYTLYTFIDCWEKPPSAR